MKLSELQVDVTKLVERATFAGWRVDCLRLLWSLAGKPVPAGYEAQALLPMLHVSYASWAERVNGFGRLAAVESLVQLPRLKVGGEVFMAMASEVFLPQLPENHRAWAPTENLLGCFAGYLSGVVSAEAYIDTAHHYRLEFGPAFCSLTPDVEYEHLFGAMPAYGLDHAVPCQCWSLSAHWLEFGKYLAARGEGWKTLKALEAAADDMAFVADNPPADEEAREGVQGLVEVQLDALVHTALEGFDDALRALVDRVVAACCGETDPSAVPVPDYIERLRAERARRERQVAEEAHRERQAESSFEKAPAVLDMEQWLKEGEMSQGAAMSCVEKPEKPEEPRDSWSAVTPPRGWQVRSAAGV